MQIAKMGPGLAGSRQRLFLAVVAPVLFPAMLVAVIRLGRRTLCTGVGYPFQMLKAKT